MALFKAMVQWLDEGVKPDVHSVATLCEAAHARYMADRLFDEDFVPLFPDDGLKPFRRSTLVQTLRPACVSSDGMAKP